ncbi:MAG TPA: permease prefix domain 1-containing protein [Chloroflexota bacterium]|nr:permease prefix domain 1-containing protein [Chloroflexota bacterium]
MEQFIDQVSGQVRTSRRRRDIIARELRSHYEESRRELEAAGWISDDAAREGIARLGNADEIGQAFDRVYRPRRRSQISLAFILAGALVLGMFSIGNSLASANATHHVQRVQTHSAPQK